VTSRLRADASRHWGQTKLAFGVDLNGRFDLQAEDVTIDFDTSGAQTEESSFTTIEDARRLDAGLYVSADWAATRVVSLGGGLRYDRVRSTNQDRALIRDGLYVALDPWGSNLFDLTPLHPTEG